MKSEAVPLRMNIICKVCLFSAMSLLFSASPLSATAANDSQVQPTDSSSRSEPASAHDGRASTASAAKEKLSNGLYLVLREADSASKLEPATKSEHVLINDYHFLEPAEHEKPNYLILSTDAFIPFVMGTAPLMDEDTHGKPKLMLQLSKQQVIPLEDFTRKYVGKSVAIVIDGQVVSAHKIREPIVGGRLQISWCTRNGCRVLMSKLQSESTRESAP